VREGESVLCMASAQTNAVHSVISSIKYIYIYHNRMWHTQNLNSDKLG